MTPIRAILVAVDFSDLLALTLPWNRHHFTSVTVVTSPADEPNVAPLCEANGADWVVTDLFYRGGAEFNKFAGLEYGLDQIGRSGFLCIMDVDILWPRKIPPWEPEFGKLYTPLRRMADPVPDPIPDESSWGQYPFHRQQREWAGYSQIFHAGSPVLGSPPWHETNWRTAGGPDSFFQAKFSERDKVRPPFECLHLGPSGENWAGRATPRLDGTVPPGAAERRERLRSLIRQRRQGPGRFDAEKLP
jgi:hypothetical protein